MRKIQFAAAALAVAASTGIGAATANAAPATTAQPATTASISIYPCYPSSIWIGICPPKCPTWPTYPLPYPTFVAQSPSIICPLY